MSGFRFRLERILNLREREESHARLELGTAVRKLEECETIVEGLKCELLENRRYVDGGSSAAEVKQAIAYGRGLELRILEGSDRAEALDSNRIALEERYWGTRRSRRVLEKLKERRKAEYEERMARKEARFLETFARYQFLKKLQERS